ncbi:MAG: hypothetical protein LRY27_04385 [Chitinophagales bacterium]|nr:hypothetical protein [Chitinophagales bacterium]
MLAVLLFTILVIAFSWFGSISFVSFFNPETVQVLFNNTFEFLILSTALFFLCIIPLSFGFYWIYKLIKGHAFSWAKSLSLASILFTICLLLIGITVYNVLKHFRIAETEIHSVNIPIKAADNEIKVSFNNATVDNDFHIMYNNGMLKTGGFTYNNELTQLSLNTISLEIEASEDTSIQLVAEAKARGKNKTEAKENLSHFSYSIQVNNGNEINIPTTLVLENQQKFRMQELTYILKLPLGTKVRFDERANKYVKGKSIIYEGKVLDLSEHTWVMNKAGLECVDCN